MSNTENRIIQISKWARKSKDGKMLKMVVVHVPNGKTVKGKQAFMSITKHIPV